MSTYAKIENITPIINDTSDAENTKPLQADPLDELIEAIRAAEFEEKGASC
tara:strand:- start:208 stop:360 length:153 start_codon:yes stop_codon:yes gene_type:complete